MYRLITITLVMMVLTIPVQSQMLDEKRTESISPSSIHKSDSEMEREAPGLRPLG